MTPQPVVHVIVAAIENDRGEVLLLQRSMQRSWAPGFWNIVSGHIEADEDSRETAFREIAEETGMRVDLLEEFPRYDLESDGKVWRTFAFRFQTADPTPVLDAEHTAFAWVPQDKIATYALAPLIRDDLRAMGYVI